MHLQESKREVPQKERKIGKQSHTFYCLERRRTPVSCRCKLLVAEHQLAENLASRVDARWLRDMSLHRRLDSGSRPVGTSGFDNSFCRGKFDANRCGSMFSLEVEPGKEAFLHESLKTMVLHGAWRFDLSH